jgi:hypothetical protein
MKKILKTIGIIIVAVVVILLSHGGAIRFIWWLEGADPTTGIVPQHVSTDNFLGSPSWVSNYNRWMATNHSK